MTEYRRILRRLDLGPGEGVGLFPLLGALGDVGQCTFDDCRRLPHVLLRVGVGHFVSEGIRMYMSSSKSRSHLVDGLNHFSAHLASGVKRRVLSEPGVVFKVEFFVF